MVTPQELREIKTKRQIKETAELTQHLDEILVEVGNILKEAAELSDSTNLNDVSDYFTRTAFRKGDDKLINLSKILDKNLTTFTTELLNRGFSIDANRIITF